jgi:5-methylthioadenosine/S-adenosylhomocysteine deaminase
LATLGGARALGLEARIGTLEPGKAADLAAFPLVSDRVTPADDPWDAALAAAERHAILVMVAGRELVRDGRLQGVETTDLRTRVMASAAALVAWRQRLPSR